MMFTPLERVSQQDSTGDKAKSELLGLFFDEGEKALIEFYQCIKCSFLRFHTTGGYCYSPRRLSIFLFVG